LDHGEVLEEFPQGFPCKKNKEKFMTSTQSLNIVLGLPKELDNCCSVDKRTNQNINMQFEILKTWLLEIEIINIFSSTLFMMT
jgi:hypothetical protein